MEPSSPQPDHKLPDRYLDRLSSEERKQHPLVSGLMDYAPDALAVIANVSYVGNMQHNAGKQMHHNRSKSGDHADCANRHLASRGTRDTDGLRHSAKAAWRTIMLLQEELEKELGLGLPRGARNE